MRGKLCGLVSSQFKMSSYSYSSRDSDITVKAVLIGDLGVGKTTFLRTFIAGKYTHRAHTSLNMQDAIEKRLMHDGNPVRLQFWDTAGQEKYRSLTTSYYRNVHACLILFDVSNEESFHNVPRWYDEMQNNVAPREISVILVGNKCHVTDRHVSQEQAQAFASEHGINYMEVSCEHDIDSVYKVCEKLIDIVMDKAKRSSSMSLPRSKGKKLQKKTKRKKSWCSC